jgi:hypothetical protein
MTKLNKAHLQAKEIILRRFFSEFLQSNTFIERLINELRFPEELEGSIPRFFREAVNQSVLYITENEKKCDVTRSARKVVSDFLTNNVLEKKIYKILVAID